MEFTKMQKILMVALLSVFIGSCSQIGEKAKNIKNTILEKIDNIGDKKNEVQTEIETNQNNEDENLVNEEPIISKKLEEVYLRTMNHWNIDFKSLPEIRAGAACIAWSNLDEDFFNNGKFQALGYSKDRMTEEAAKDSALQSCEQLRLDHRLEDTCECTIVLINDINQITNTN